MSIASKHHISFMKVGSLEDFDNLKEFAKTFDHELFDSDLSSTIIKVYHEGELIGYICIYKNAIAFPAFHPEKSTPGLSYKATAECLAWAKMQGAMNGDAIIGFVARDDNSPFTDEHMAKMGLLDTGMRLFKVKG